MRKVKPSELKLKCPGCDSVFTLGEALECIGDKPCCPMCDGVLKIGVQSVQYPETKVAKCEP